MKQIILYCLAIITIAVILSSCSGRTSNKDVDYFPVSNGNKWEYTVDYTTQSQSVQKGRMIRRVDGKEKIGDKEYFKVVTVFSGIPGAESQTIYFRKSDEGTFLIDAKFQEFSEWLDFKFPVEVGMTWKANTPYGEFVYEITGIETLELINKKFKNCIKVKFINSKNNWEGYSYIARGIGIVRIVQKINRITYDYTIEKFDIS